MRGEREADLLTWSFFQYSETNDEVESRDSYLDNSLIFRTQHGWVPGGNDL